nr:MAG TPA: hypothetical protein [Caudoviricetes sp.]
MLSVYGIFSLIRNCYIYSLYQCFYLFNSKYIIHIIVFIIKAFIIFSYLIEFYL